MMERLISPTVRSAWRSKGTRYNHQKNGAQIIVVIPAYRKEDAVPEDAPSINAVLAEYQAYLETLAAIQISPRLRSKFGWSDIIQKTLLEAFAALSTLQSLDEQSRQHYL